MLAESMEGFSNSWFDVSAKERVTTYAKQVQHLLNHKVLGDDERPAQSSIAIHDMPKLLGQ
jgi:hypothetical protein